LAQGNGALGSGIFSNMVVPKPSEIKAILDDYVIGQDRAKKVLSVAVHNHYKCILNRGRIQHVELQKGGRKHPEQDYIRVDTANILFICGGVFVGLDQIITDRTTGKRLGFEANRHQVELDGHTSVLHEIRSEDLFKFGMIPEFVGRFPVLTTLSDLDVSALLRILTEPRNALIKQYQALFEIKGVTLQFTEGAVKSVARRAAEMKIGAWRLPC
jgi:endopeptidase Clp ATP-binding regulatory subunit ClpX